ncbi:MAG: indolepyruvate oxidoreductase subunit beta [Gammaproteobacteria bacterium]|nr:indolepyruvate oxidoreductase subunit beta [Rhodocyclaceae bacterium]MBU3909644.1 indolepyruvate oxidoreductase subunit beta [Gammaproteobacteria bacterium]MBU3987959.1 indolepyruvate oxidoreductase subunit beta [Gammaproteobacteria bacterium]MBU4005177.1 indolepyruvate oxidoreductase subunit beta [Gammaproteobacteria bacterium]MBU4022356.1 indolepyruvate oxidoreductase subunit beta [Gammaproteobacteria bacterium]
MENNITNILVCGIGGQGVMTATEILAEAAIAEGHDAKKTEVAGMAQRGGVVTSHLRFGPKVLSPQIAPGTVHVLLGFEAAEALRWSAYLRPDGLALVNDSRLVPPVVEIGLFEYPADPIGDMRAAGIHTVSFDAATIASDLGDLRLGNTVMLGAIADHLPFSADVLLRCIEARFAKKGVAIVELNRSAFAAGRAAAAQEAVPA